MSIENIKRVGDQSAHVVTHKDGTKVLYSYDTPVAESSEMGLKHTSKKWSVTTSRHINKFLAEDGRRSVPTDQEYFDQAHGTLVDVKFNHKQKKETQPGTMNVMKGSTDNESKSKIKQNPLSENVDAAKKSAINGTLESHFTVAGGRYKHTSGGTIEARSAGSVAGSDRAPYKWTANHADGSTSVHKDLASAMSSMHEHSKQEKNNPMGVQDDESDDNLMKMHDALYSHTHHNAPMKQAHNHPGGTNTHSHHDWGISFGPSDPGKPTERTARQREASKSNLVHAREAHRNKMHSAFHDAAKSMSGNFYSSFSAKSPYYTAHHMHSSGKIEDIRTRAEKAKGMTAPHYLATHASGEVTHHSNLDEAMKHMHEKHMNGGK
jgi:hypothetical protein